MTEGSILFATGRVFPQPVASDLAVIKFTGDGEARFRVQHARDCDGRPDTLSWCDVSNLSNAMMTPQQAITDESLVRGFMVDIVRGDTAVTYRRHTAGWLRVIPFDTSDKDMVKACRNYTVTMEAH